MAREASELTPFDGMFDPVGDEVAQCDRCGFVDIVFTREHVRGERGSRGSRGLRGNWQLFCRNCIDYLKS